MCVYLFVVDVDYRGRFHPTWSKKSPTFFDKWSKTCSNALMMAVAAPPPVKPQICGDRAETSELFQVHIVLLAPRKVWANPRRCLQKKKIMGRFLTSFASDADDMGVGTMLGLAQTRNAWLSKLYTNNHYMLPRPNDPNIVWGSHHYLILLAKKVILASLT